VVRNRQNQPRPSSPLWPVDTRRHWVTQQAKAWFGPAASVFTIRVKRPTMRGAHQSKLSNSKETTRTTRNYLISGQGDQTAWTAHLETSRSYRSRRSISRTDAANVRWQNERRRHDARCDRCCGRSRRRLLRTEFA
jgi:hypothetical protein